MVKRQTVASIEAQKHQMISALYANSAFDEDKQGVEARQERIKGIEHHFNKAIEIVYNPSLHKESEIDWTNPFWAAARRAQQRRLERFRGEASVAEVIQENPEPDEDAIAKRMAGIDQLN